MPKNVTQKKKNRKPEKNEKNIMKKIIIRKKY